MSIKLHREGHTLIPVSLMVILGLWILGFWLHPILGYILVLPALALSWIIFNFFRDPEVDVASDENQVLSPCDGKVVVIEEVNDPLYFQGPVRQISIYMSPLDVHVNRNPISGKIKMLRYFPGKYLMAFNPKSSSLNEQNYIVAANEKVTVAYKQIAGFLARRIKWYVQENESVLQGDEYGFIRFGSRVDVLVPLECEITVQLGDKVKAGVSSLAKVG